MYFDCIEYSYIQNGGGNFPSPQIVAKVPKGALFFAKKYEKRFEP